MKLKTISLKLSRKLQDNEVASLIQPIRLHYSSSATANPDPLPEEVASSSELNAASFASKNSSCKETSSFRSQEPCPDHSVPSPSASETSPQVKPSNLITSLFLISCFSSDSESSDELSLLNKGATSSAVDPSSIDSSSYLKDLRSAKRKPKIATLTSVLIANNLASNLKSLTLFRPKRRPAKAPVFEKIFPPFKKSSSLFLQSLELSPSNPTSVFESSFSFYLNSSEFPKSLTLTSEETLDNSQELQESISDLKKKTKVSKKESEKRKKRIGS